jgi:LPXTG-motif cell wall-anchored protein
VPETVVAQERKVTGTLPPPPSPPPANMPVLVVVTRKVAPPSLQGAAAKQAPTELPKTASHMPLVGLVGLVCLSLSLGLRILRRLWAAGLEQ